MVYLENYTQKMDGFRALVKDRDLEKNSLKGFIREGFIEYAKIIK